MVFSFSFLYFFFYVYADPRELTVLTHSFPTRRSSDLISPDPRELQPDRRHRGAQPVVDTCLERKMATDKRLDPPCPIDTALRRPMIEDCGFDVGETKVDPIAGAVRPGCDPGRVSDMLQ